MSFVHELRMIEAMDGFRSAIEGYRPSAQDPDLTERIRERAQRERLTLVLGAGVSRSVNLPQWSDLVGSLVRKVFAASNSFSCDAEQFLLAGTSDPLRQIGYLGDLLNFKSTLINEVRTCLYENYDPTLEPVLLEPICQTLLLGSSPSRIFNVITYNFDNTLEICIRRLGENCDVVVSADSYGRATRGLKVFHPHGYLPMSDQYADEANIVFSEPDYHAQYAIHTTWANVIQLHHLSSRRCLFVGVSLNDPNMRRLLSLQGSMRDERGAPRHVAIQVLSKSNVANFFQERQLLQLGVDVLWVQSHSDVAKAIRACFA